MSETEPESGEELIDASGRNPTQRSIDEDGPVQPPRDDEAEGEEPA